MLTPIVHEIGIHREAVTRDTFIGEYTTRARRLPIPREVLPPVPPAQLHEVARLTGGLIAQQEFAAA